MRNPWPTFLLVIAGSLSSAAAPAGLQLPAFPQPAFVLDGGRPQETSSTRLMRDMFRGGVRGMERFEAADTDYGLLRSDTVGLFAAWLEKTCQAVGCDLAQMRARVYDAGTFARLLEVSAALAVLQNTDKRTAPLAVPIGLLLCKRDVAWGELKRDGTTDAYIVFGTDAGILVYDPPTRQLVNLADFPNKDGVVRIRF